MFCTVCLQLYCVQTYFTYSVWFSLLTTSALVFFPTDLLCGGTPVGCKLWFVLLAAEYIMLSVLHNETGLLENPIKVAFKSDYKCSKNEHDVSKQCETG